MIEEEALTGEVLLKALDEVYSSRDRYISAMSDSGQMDSIGTIMSLIETEAKTSTANIK